MFRQVAALSLYISIPLFLFLYLTKVYGAYKFQQISHIIDVVFYPIITPMLMVMSILSKNIHSPSMLSQIVVNMIGLIYIYGLVFCLIFLFLLVKKYVFGASI